MICLLFLMSVMDRLSAEYVFSLLFGRKPIYGFDVCRFSEHLNRRPGTHGFSEPVCGPVSCSAASAVVCDCRGAVAVWLRFYLDVYRFSCRLVWHFSFAAFGGRVLSATAL